MSGKCSTKTNGTTCIGTDIDENNVECWTTRNDIDAGDCVRSWMENMDATHNILPKEWIKRLFDKEIISLGGKNRR